MDGFLKMFRKYLKHYNLFIFQMDKWLRISVKEKVRDVCLVIQLVKVANKKEIIQNLKEVSTYPVHTMVVKDLITGDECIRNTSVAGNAVNQWFPTMMKTGISY